MTDRRRGEEKVLEAGLGKQVSVSERQRSRNKLGSPPREREGQPRLQPGALETVEIQCRGKEALGSTQPWLHFLHL